MTKNTIILILSDTMLNSRRRALHTLYFCKSICVLFAIGVASIGYAQENAEPAPLPQQAAPTSSQASTSSQFQAIDFIATDIASFMLDDQYTLIDITLDAGGENETPHQFPVFVTPSKKPLSMGTFYLVSDVAYNGAQIHSLMLLAEQMSNFGWHSVVMPAPPLMMVMAEVDAKKAAAQAKFDVEQTSQTNQLSDSVQATAEQAGSRSAVIEAENDAGNDAKDDQQASIASETQQPNIQTMVAAQFHQSQFDELYREAFNEYLKTFLIATMRATEQTGYKVFFAQGISAQSLIHINGKDLTPDALVINNLYWPQQTINQSLPILMAQHSAPLLDLVSDQDNKWASATESDRKIKAAVEIKAHYRQRHIGMFGLTADISSDTAKEIYGWLTYLGW